MFTQVDIALLPATGCAPLGSFETPVAGAAAAGSAVLYWEALPGDRGSVDADPVGADDDVVEQPGRSCTFITGVRDAELRVA